MPIDKKRKILFIHIPKTAGGSIEKAFGIYGTNNKGSNFIDPSIAYGYNQVNYANRKIYRAETKVSSWYSHLRAIKSKLHPFENEKIPLQHANYIELQKLYNLKNVFKFSFVRNPYERLLSAYKWLNVKKDFNNFVREDLNQLVNENYYFFPQHSFLENSSKEIPIDYIGRFESLTSDLEHLMDILRIKIKLKNIHQSLSVNTAIRIDSDSEQIIKKIYKKDFSLFDYNPNYQSSSD